jgi:L-ascorbate metabolism protein UlaG (beta-lactamase superfamily)
MKITFYGHACFSIEIKEKHILFDPFISGNELASNIDIDSIQADYILLSHGHQDHVLDVPAIAKRTGAKIVSNFEIVSWYGGQGLTNSHPMNHGGSWTFDFGTVKYVNAIHSSVLPDGTYGGNPGGFVIESEEGNFYYSGDTALTYDMKLINDSHDLDFAILCLGDNFTMGYKDACTAADFVGVNRVVGMHFDTFGYIKVEHEEVEDYFARNSKILKLPAIGETFEM